MGIGLFTRTCLVYKAKGKKAEWLKARQVLVAAGLDLSASHQPAEAPVGGCGAKLDIRDYFPGGKVDREIYYIDVRKEEGERARSLLRQAGLPTVTGS